MRKYEKIETIYVRDTTGSKKLIPGVYRDNTVSFLSGLNWIWSEKIDGTNIRVYWDGHKVSFGGRTDAAVIPTQLLEKLNFYFGGLVNEELFEQTFGEKEVILFGEGYGHKIQNGGNYVVNDVDFALFDVLIGENYQSRATIEEIASIFNVSCAPIVGQGTLDEAVAYVKTHPNSVIAEKTREMEGIVCRPEYELRDRCGKRIIVKIKWEDFK